MTGHSVIAKAHENKSVTHGMGVTEDGIFERSVAFSDRATIRHNTIQYDTIQKVVFGKISLLKRIVNFLRNP